MQDTTTIAVFGAGGNMGTRVTNALRNEAGYRMLNVEKSEQGRTRLRERGLEISEQEDALREADVAILAVPDALIGEVATSIVPDLKSGAMLICLDPAAPYAGKLPEREDVSYFVTHPAHPPVFNDETDPEARRDFFGSGKAKQAVVNAIMQGPEEDYARGEAIASKMWKPVLRSHRVTVEQMAMLEPVLSETVACTCAVVMREAMDESIRRGVPAEAARDFLMGHINIALAVAFDEIEWDFSAGAKMAIEEAKKDIFQPDWKKVFEPESLRQSVANITGDVLPMG
jgi:D-apionate oxidoisomerase